MIDMESLADMYISQRKGESFWFAAATVSK